MTDQVFCFVGRHFLYISIVLEQFTPTEKFDLGRLKTVLASFLIIIIRKFKMALNPMCRMFFKVPKYSVFASLLYD